MLLACDVHRLGQLGRECQCLVVALLLLVLSIDTWNVFTVSCDQDSAGIGNNRNIAAKIPGSVILSLLLRYILISVLDIYSVNKTDRNLIGHHKWLTVRAHMGYFACSTAIQTIISSFTFVNLR